MQAGRHKFHVLDGLRGVAAYAVLVYHASPSTQRMIPHGYLAVDFFFMLSGFVMAFSYQGRLDSGKWSPFRFMLERAARLYPVYIVGVVLGLAFVLAQGSVGGGHPAPLQAFISTSPEVSFLPDCLATHTSGLLFSLDLPLWSLFFEMAAYLAYSQLLRNRSTAYLRRLLGVCWLILLWQGLSQGSLDLGTTTATIGGGFARVAFAYVAGLLLYRVWQQGAKRLQVSGLIVAGVLLGALLLPVRVPIYDLATVSFLFPAILLVGAYSVEQPWMRPACVNLGLVSYPLYVIHVPLLKLVARSLVHVHVTVPHRLLLICLLLITTLAAFLLERFYDLPVRTFLKNKLAQRDQRAMAQ